MAGTSTLRRSNGTVISSSLTDYTNRGVVHNGHGSATNTGDKSFTDVKLSASQDASYLAASSGAPVQLGIDNVHWTPKRYPET